MDVQISLQEAPAGTEPLPPATSHLKGGTRRLKSRLLPNGEGVHFKSDPKRLKSQPAIQGE